MKKKQTEDLIGECIMENYQRLYRLAYSYMHNEDDAMDIVQESAYKAMKSVCEIREQQYMLSWIYRIVINTSLDMLRKKKREQIGVEDYMADYEDQYHDTDILNSLQVLDETERQIIILRFFEERKLAEIAEIMDENLSTVKSRLYRALKKLKIELSEYAEV